MSANLNLCGGVEVALPHHTGALIQTALVAPLVVFLLVCFGVGHALTRVPLVSCRGLVTLSFSEFETKVLHVFQLFGCSPLVDTSTFIDDHHLHLRRDNLVLFVLSDHILWLDNIDSRSE